MEKCTQVELHRGTFDRTKMMMKLPGTATALPVGAREKTKSGDQAGEIFKSILLSSQEVMMQVPREICVTSTGGGGCGGGGGGVGGGGGGYGHDCYGGGESSCLLLSAHFNHQRI